MAELKLDDWDGNADVTKGQRKLYFEWPCGATYNITPRALEKLIEQIESVRGIKGVLIPAAGLKTGTFEVQGIYLEVVGSKITPFADYDRSGTFTLPDLKRAVKKALA